MDCIAKDSLRRNYLLRQTSRTNRPPHRSKSSWLSQWLQPHRSSRSLSPCHRIQRLTHRLRRRNPSQILATKSRVRYRQERPPAGNFILNLTNRFSWVLLPKAWRIANATKRSTLDPCTTQRLTQPTVRNRR